MKIELDNQTALVTGSTAGIGWAIARGLAAAGATVVINGRTQERVDRALAAIFDELGAKTPVRGFVGDLSDPLECQRLLEAEPRCDILVNNLGIYGLEDFFETSDETFERFFQTNVMSGVRLSRGYASEMAARGYGRIVFLSSESALNVPKDMIHYGMTKTMQLSLARGLAKRLQGTGVTVNSVLPGPTLSEGLETMLEHNAQEAGISVEKAGVEFVKAHRPSSIIARPATVDEVAHMVVYVCSPQASATTGAALRVDGGVVDSIV